MLKATFQRATAFFLWDVISPGKCNPHRFLQDSPLRQDIGLFIKKKRKM
jgi:hypothetical protein